MIGVLEVEDRYYLTNIAGRWPEIVSPESETSELYLGAVRRQDNSWRPVVDGRLLKTVVERITDAVEKMKSGCNRATRSVADKICSCQIHFEDTTRIIGGH